MLAVAAALTSGCSSPSSGSANGGPPTTSSATKLLARHAAAVRAHATAAFLADIDTEAPSRPYRDEQRTELANLAEVPLAQWSYAVVGVITDPTANRAASTRYHSTVLLLHVTLDYELRGIDPRPSPHDEYLVFVARGGRTYLAGDDALAAQSTPSWVGPWHYGPLVAARGSDSLVLGPPADRAQLPGLARATDAAIAAVTLVWGRAWSRRVAVIVPSSAAEFTALTGSGSTDVSAAAVTDGIDSATGQPYGQRLVLNPSQLSRLSATGRGIVLRHEVTHLASAADTADITPRWLVEGFADYVANLTSGQSVRAAAPELRQAVAAGRLPARLPADTAFAAHGTALARIYEQSWLACRLIAARIGTQGLVRFYGKVGTALEPAAGALADAFHAVLREPEAAFIAQWRAYLTAQLS